MTTPRFRRRSTAALVIATSTAALAAGCSTGPGQDSSDATELGWSQRQAQRNAAVADYLEDNAVEFEWFKNNPIGFSGIPYVMLRVMTNMPELGDIWPADMFGFAPHPEDYEDGVLKPEDERKHRFPYGMTYRDPQMNGVDGLSAEAAEKAIDKVFFSCGACHTGRVNVPAEDGSPRILHVFGAPNTEIDAQLYTRALKQSAERLAGDAKLAAQVENNIDYWDWDFFYDEYFYAQKEKLAVDVAFDTVLEKLIAGGQKASLIYETLPNATGSYPGYTGYGPRIGQMDAYGIAAGLVVLHTNRRSYFENLPSDHPFFDGLEGLDEEAKFQAAGERLRSTAHEWMPQVPAPIDIASLYHLDQRHHAGWDANQGASARVIASGTSAVGDPYKLNLPAHEMMNDFASELPAPAYPFEVDLGLAEQGEAIFESNCGVCHKPNNDRVYTIAQLDGVDDHRAQVLSPTARLGLIALMREACQGEAWCQAAGETVEEQDGEYLRPIRSADERGYKADVLHGLWSTAPYLHNGSVPTLWHMLHPEARPQSFVRGNINYDTEKVGFVWDETPAPGSYDGVRTAVYEVDPAQGRSNAGHTFGSNLSEDEKTALLEYLKTL